MIKKLMLILPIFSTIFSYKIAISLNDIAALTPIIAFSIFLFLFMNISFLFRNIFTKV